MCQLNTKLAWFGRGQTTFSNGKITTKEIVFFLCLIRWTIVLFRRVNTRAKLFIMCFQPIDFNWQNLKYASRNIYVKRVPDVLVCIGRYVGEIFPAIKNQIVVNRWFFLLAPSNPQCMCKKNDMLWRIISQTEVNDCWVVYLSI